MFIYFLPAYSKTLLGKDEIDEATRQLLTHVPNSLIYFDYKKDMPATKEFLGVVLFADISGENLGSCPIILKKDGTRVVTSLDFRSGEKIIQWNLSKVDTIGAKLVHH